MIWGDYYAQGASLGRGQISIVYVSSYSLFSHFGAWTHLEALFFLEVDVILEL